MKEKNNKKILMIATSLFVVALAFGSGFLIGKKIASVKKNIGQFANMRGNGQQFGNIQKQGQGQQIRGFRPINGEIISADEKSVTVKLADGSSKIILLSDKTEVNKAETGSVKDLKTGEKVMIVGQDNTDGSVNATSIQLNPMVRKN